MDSKEILEAQLENHQEPAPEVVENTLPFKVGDWVTCDELHPAEYHISEVDGDWFASDKFVDKRGTITQRTNWNHLPGTGWEFRVVGNEPSVKPDSLDVKLFSVHRSAPSKGYEVALFPGAPFGPEVVLSLRERGILDVEVAVETPEGKEEFVSIVMGAVTVLMDLHTAEEIARALYHHALSEDANETGEEVQA